ncbi:MAG: isoprenylcysteine carboxylmethyltransferase family protein, partial [Novosphingobium sp.]
MAAAMKKPSPKSAARPRSDVSVGVGLCGLAGLFAWILICRNWAGIADYFTLPGPREPMSGPYASLAAVVFSTGPMVAWSLLVDKVHRRESTGIDWASKRRVGEILDVSITKLAGLWATWAVIAGIYCIARWYWRDPYLFAMEVLGAAAVPLFLLSIPYVVWLDRKLIEPRDGAWHFGAMLIGREAWDGREIARHWRAWAVKGFFCAFMISILPPGFEGVVKLDFGAITGDPVQISIWLAELLFVVDVQIAMVGYLLTMKPLDAQIRSANPHLAGWVAALICYPPFILMSDDGPLNYQVNSGDWAMWLDGNTTLLWLWGGLLVVLTAIYAWATVAFGLRFSNLTYRGVVTNGPYMFTRHPAYLSKNLFWWCATMPWWATSHSLTDMVRNTTLLALVSAVYYWRARTEEQHLCAEDAKYREYSEWMQRNGL